MQLFSRQNASKNVATRWGVVKFNADGVAEHDIPEKDQALIAQLGWDVDITALRDKEREALRTAANAPTKSEATVTATKNVILQASGNANREVKTRWGVIKFDADGVATASIPVSDLHLPQQLGWTCIVDEMAPTGQTSTSDPSKMPGTKSPKKA